MMISCSPVSHFNVNTCFLSKHIFEKSWKRRFLDRLYFFF